MQQQQGSNVIPLPVQTDRTPDAILKVVRHQVDERVEYLLSGLAENFADALFEEMTRVDEEEKLTRHFNLMRTLRAEEKVVRESFQVLVDYHWQTMPAGVDDSNVPMPTGRAKNVIEKFSNKTANHYKVLLQETGLRLESLFPRSESLHPLQPALYCRAYWHALAGLALSYDERLMLLALFNRFVMDRYGQVLAILNRTLIQLKVETKLHTSTSSQ